MVEKTKKNYLKDFFCDITLQKTGVFALLALNGIFLFNIYIQHSKIESLNNTIQNLSAINSSHLKKDAQAIFQSSFKDDLVLNSFSNSITIIIAFFTTLIALAAFYSFKKIDQDIDTLKEKALEIEDTKTSVEQSKAQISKQILAIEQIDTNLNYIHINTLRNQIERYFHQISTKLIKSNDLQSLENYDLYSISTNFSALFKCASVLISDQRSSLIPENTEDITERIIFFLRTINLQIVKTKHFLTKDQKKRFFSQLDILKNFPENIPANLKAEFFNSIELLTDEKMENLPTV